MPRHNRPRTIGGESTLAERIALLREQNEMTYEALAEAMTKAGCAVDKSAIYRIEKGTPRRTVSVDELIALSHVFDLTIDDLLRPIPLVEQEWAEEIAKDFIEATSGLDDAHASLVRAALKYADVRRRAPAVAEFVAHQWLTASPGRQWGNEFEDALAPAVIDALEDKANDFWELVLAVVDLKSQTDS